MASEKWAGFTDEDIERIKTHPTNRKGKKETAGPLKIKDINTKTLKHEAFLSELSKEETSYSDVDLNKSSLQLKNTSKPEELQIPNGVLDSAVNSNSLSSENIVPNILKDSSKSNESLNKDFKEKICENETSPSIAELELFEMRRKRIEAENAKRRALINKAITDKKMQTQAEARKLATITQELNRLDSILSADVSILRDYIEEASLEFTKAEKRYLKAEKEFIEAKLNLYEKMQRKEQLTEHLCAVIEQNENRKANKLVELMKQLEMETIIEDYEIHDTQPILSKFCHLNDETYHCCQTLKPTQKAPARENESKSIISEGETQNENSIKNESCGSEK
ncbi:RAB6-interacting golgin [Caerostris darwini]|uniref:RAB6-interacting golgin n=1 Tax=Caerostris darwini TaxID=1538125 RepID=A0AAV4TQA6_9ARAC|nr:RAB6-interacting golgin [Caerostris darwini]